MASYLTPKISPKCRGAMENIIFLLHQFFLNRRYINISRSLSIFNMKSFLCVHHNSDATGIIKRLHGKFKLHTRNPFAVCCFHADRSPPHVPNREKRSLPAGNFAAFFTSLFQQNNARFPSGPLMDLPLV